MANTIDKNRRPGGKSENQKLKSLLVEKVLLHETDEEHALSSTDIIAHLGLYGIDAERHGVARAYRLASLVAPSAKTVPQTVFFRILRMLPPCSNPLLPFSLTVFRNEKAALHGLLFMAESKGFEVRKKGKKTCKKVQKKSYFTAFF